MSVPAHQIEPKRQQEQHISASPGPAHDYLPTLKSQDQYELARTGKKQVLKRTFGLMSMLGFSCTLLATWEGQLIGFLLGFSNGGPAGLVYGYIIVWIGTTSMFIVLSELASMAPTAGGQYHWAYVLAPRSYRRILSYITGWLTVAGWQAGVVSGAYLTATIIQGLIILNNANYIYQAWHGTLLLWAVLFACVFVNTIISRYLPKIEGIILILHVVGFFAILVPLVTLADHSSAAEIFTLFINDGGWSNQGLSFLVGLTGTVFSFLGADGVIHMSEEVQNASVNVPRAIMAGVMINGTLGFGMLLTILFCLGNVSDPSPYIYPFIEIFVESTSSVHGSTAMAALIVFMAFCTTIGILASSSRMTWSFARDRGLPGWQFLSKVDERSSIPLIAILTTTIISALLGLINIGSSTALSDLLSLAINSWYASYLIIGLLLLKHRVQGTIQVPAPTGSTTAEDFADNTNMERLVWGPWRVPGAMGTINNTIACLYMTLILFFSFWPTALPVTPSNMNFSVLVTGFTVIFSMVYYFLWGKRTFAGPVVDIIAD